MKKGFVITRNYRLMAEADKALQSRGAREAGFLIIKGVPGVGKSETVERWASEPANTAIFLRAKETWTKRALLDALAEAMSLDTRGRNSEVQARVITRLATTMATLVFDEADHMVSRTSVALLEVVRDITDMTGAPCVLVGMDNFVTTVSKHAHLRSRVWRVVEFQPLDAADVAQACKAKCEVELADEVVTELARQADGRMRLALNGIAYLEQLARANGLQRVTGQHVAGKALCEEFHGSAYRRATR